jgi:hypothetical protein
MDEATKVVINTDHLNQTDKINFTYFKMYNVILRCQNNQKELIILLERELESYILPLDGMTLPEPSEIQEELLNIIIPAFDRIKERINYFLFEFGSDEIDLKTVIDFATFELCMFHYWLLDLKTIFSPLPKTEHPFFIIDRVSEISEDKFEMTLNFSETKATMVQIEVQLYSEKFLWRPSKINISSIETQKMSSATENGQAENYDRRKFFHDGFARFITDETKDWRKLSSWVTRIQDVINSCLEKFK